MADFYRSPDAAFVALPRALTPDAVAALRALGCGGAVIYAAGFAETGDLDRQRSLLEAADGMPLLGPNCYGFINTTARVALWPDEHALSPVERGVALVTQSGNIGCNLTMMQRGLPIATLLTLGNQADVDIRVSPPSVCTSRGCAIRRPSRRPLRGRKGQASRWSRSSPAAHRKVRASP